MVDEMYHAIARMRADVKYQFGIKIELEQMHILMNHEVYRALQCSRHAISVFNQDFTTAFGIDFTVTHDVEDFKVLMEVIKVEKRV